MVLIDRPGRLMTAGAAFSETNIVPVVGWDTGFFKDQETLRIAGQVRERNGVLLHIDHYRRTNPAGRKKREDMSREICHWKRLLPRDNREQ